MGEYACREGFTPRSPLLYTITHPRGRPLGYCTAAGRGGPRYDTSPKGATSPATPDADAAAGAAAGRGRREAETLLQSQEAHHRRVVHLELPCERKKLPVRRLQVWRHSSCPQGKNRSSRPHHSGAYQTVFQTVAYEENIEQDQVLPKHQPGLYECLVQHELPR